MLKRPSGQPEHYMLSSLPKTPKQSSLIPKTREAPEKQPMTASSCMKFFETSGPNLPQELWNPKPFAVRSSFRAVQGLCPWA